MDVSGEITVKTKTPDVLSPLCVPLVGRSLIEASAGTGKTYTLSLLYLRLLLGIGEQPYTRPLSVDEILVVTFTQAATEELRYRIRENIHQLRIACLRGKHPDPLYQQLLALVDDPHYAAQTLLFAEQQMDEAAIYTIHGFCQRVLTTNAFESGVLFEQQLVQDESRLQLQVVQDFWRRFFYPLSHDLARVIEQIWSNPNALLADVSPYLHVDSLSKTIQTDTPLNEFIATFHTEKVAKIEKIKALWCKHRSEIEPIIQSSDINKRSYNSRNLTNWLKQVDVWASATTNDYHLSEKLSQFSSEVMNEKSQSNPPVHDLFDAIAQLYRESFNLKYALIFPIVNWIRQALQNEKQSRAEMGFDDLLGQLHKALTSKSKQLLSETLAKRYPVAMIDEFQDTDPIQYQIFNQIYQQREQTGLLFIGDPKQAIYGFRGADIFTYIQAKKCVDNYFTMDTNWRSCSEMVHAVNQLFSHQRDPFIFSEIPFIPVNAAKRNLTKQVKIQGQVIAAMQCNLLPEAVSSVSHYQQMSAANCADQIYTLLDAGNNQKAVFMDNDQQKKVVTSADIAILVRTGTEAEIMRQALIQRGIRSVYLSNRHSVFQSPQAKELLWFLQAVQNPENERYIHTALATQLLSISMTDVDEYNRDQDRFEDIIEEFEQYRFYWDNFGVLVMLRRMMSHRRIAENLLTHSQGERIVTDIMHLGELLQAISGELDSQPALLRWFSQQIRQPDPNLENHEQRLESDENLVKIVTIHKSKGLEYPIVYLPFIGHFRNADKNIYHDRNSYELRFAMQSDPETRQLIEEERLAEDLRLLYVALTRSIYLCVISIAGLKNRGSNTTTLHESAIGYLIQQGEEGDYALFKACLSQLSAFDVNEVDITDETTKQLTENREIPHLTANKFNRQLDERWIVTSYSGLQQTHPTGVANTLADELLPTFDLDARADESLESRKVDAILSSSPTISMHTFPKGAHVGTLLHRLMECIDFTQPDKLAILPDILDRLNLSQEWYPMFSDWLDTILSVPLSSDGLSLNQVPAQKRLIELQFYLPIRHTLSAIKLDRLCKAYDPLSSQCGVLSFSDVQGMLKGFIDLVFEWQGRFYILDYKSNWLGPDCSAYSTQALQKAMCEHRYDLQYQLYTLALHRYLRQRIEHYDYETHFGGVFYLFLRGMRTELPKNGVFSYRPPYDFIQALDELFG